MSGDGGRDERRVLVLSAIPARKVWLVMHEAASLRPEVRVVSDAIAAIFDRMLIATLQA
jgi:hypothetical protein